MDQDAVDFMKKFFSFEDPDASRVDSPTSQEAYIRKLAFFLNGIYSIFTL